MSTDLRDAISGLMSRALDCIDEARLAEPCTVEVDLDRRRQREALQKAIAALDPRKRSTIQLFYSENRSIAEIARLQNKSQSAVKMNLLRARRELSRIILGLMNKKSR